MSGRAAAISFTRLMNQGLTIISPMVLVRLLSVEDFGRYREFLLYAGLLTGAAAFGVNSSLLRFVPEDPRQGWRFVNQAALMTLATSVLAALGVVGLNVVFAGKLVGDYAFALALYVVFFVNMDFWEALWLAEKRSFAVLGYTTARLIARMVVVIASAAMTRDVGSIIAALIAVEAVRLLISSLAWRRRIPADRPMQLLRWSEQLQYCLLFGSALVVTLVNKSLGALFVAKMLGPVALAHYSIGTYLQPVITVIRNSISDVVLPEMASRNADPQSEPLELWRRTSVVTAILLLGAGVVLARFAEVLVVTLFSREYYPAVGLFQLYLLVFLRETLDFGIPLRAINRTADILHSNLIAIAVNALAMLVLAPLWGAIGAVLALVLSRFVEGAYLAVQTARAYNVSLREVAPWADLAKVLGAGAVATGVLYGQFWTQSLGVFGVVLATPAYMATFMLALAVLRLPEAMVLVRFLRSAPVLVQRRLQ